MAKHKYLLATIGLLMMAAITYLTTVRNTDNPEPTEVPEDTAASQPVIKYGINLSNYIVHSHVVSNGELFSDILNRYHVADGIYKSLARLAKGVFNFNQLRAGNTCTILCEKEDNRLVAKKLIYEESKVSYVIFNLHDSLYVYRGRYAVERHTRTAAGTIKSSLYETLENKGIPPALAIRMAEIFAWTIDFHKLREGDKFKVIYEEDIADGQSVGLGEIKGIIFNHAGKEYQAYYYEKGDNSSGSFYDEEGNSMRKQFLKSPVKYSRITSRYAKRRFHPVTRQWKPHLGTDYAAPHGTPILATADGVVEEARYKAFNGKYVKIKHNGQYKTQYLHMSRIARNIRPGVRVKQGDVIGYVGSTGLATGPHVCYRFWKDGKQVDPLKEKLAFSEPLPAKHKNIYLKQIEPLKKQLAELDWDSVIPAYPLLQAKL
ncbi:MAG: peptidoglycan DD-metalloendopeptidase family protein [Chitinophagales bacterium]|nr:peptidoglycan DD-metalloendopeptidase family protein [Chitinophagales bacterium]MDW8418750.1 peptidoglycan DD-metalloendopeptidase family protein [Chitinophagales bacterium]